MTANVTPATPVVILRIANSSLYTFSTVVQYLTIHWRHLFAIHSVPHVVSPSASFTTEVFHSTAQRNRSRCLTCRDSHHTVLLTCQSVSDTYRNCIWQAFSTLLSDALLLYRKQSNYCTAGHRLRLNSQWPTFLCSEGQMDNFKEVAGRVRVTVIRHITLQYVTWQ